jgi:hypothetical protein
MEAKKYYTPAVKKAILVYRAKHQEEYNEYQRDHYAKNKEDEEWRKIFNEKCREANQRHRDNKRKLLGDNVKGRGRPRKETTIILEQIE